MIEGPSGELVQTQERLLQLEADLDVFDLTIDGIPVWERVRFSIYRQIRSAENDMGESQPSAGMSARDYLSLWGRNLVYRNPYLASSRDLLFWGHERRQHLDDGLYWDIYCDPLHDSLEYDYLQVEERYETGHLTPAKTENLRYFDLIQITAGIKRQLGLVSSPLDEDDRRRLQEIEQAFSREFDASIDVEEPVRIQLSNRRAIKGLYRRFLRRIDPEVVVIVVGQTKPTFIEVCKELDVPVVELQHGVVTPYHPGYSFPGDRTKYAFPDYFFTYGDFWTENVPYPIPDDRVLTVGYAHLEHERERFTSSDQSDQIVFVSQGTIGEDLSKFAVELRERNDIDAQLVYKLHPDYYDHWRSSYPWLVDADIRVVDDDGPSLYELFGESTVQVGAYSTAVFEGLCFDLDTYVVDLPGARGYMADVLDQGFAELVSSPADLAATLSEQTGGSRGLSVAERERLFRSNAAERFAECLDQVRSRS